MTTDRTEYDIRQVLDELSAIEGRGTELITVYVTPDTNLNTVEQQIATEHAQAENIKSDRTQKNVQSALSRVKSILASYPETPDNGLAVFVGTIDDDVIEYTFDTLPRAIPERNYICDSTFALGPLKQVLTPDSTYGLIVLDRNEATIGSLVGDRVQVHRELESGVMGKTKAGGQSAQRFARERERQKHEFFVKIAEAAKEAFIADNELTINGLLLGGTTITVDDFTSEDLLDYRLRDAVLGTYGTSYGNKQGLEEVVRKAEDVLNAREDIEAKQAMDQFFNGLTDSTDIHATYGTEAVEQALQYGAVDTLLLSETLESNTVDALLPLADETGAETLFVSTSFEKGGQLEDAFGGVAALLRYDLQTQ